MADERWRDTYDDWKTTEPREYELPDNGDADDEEMSKTKPEPAVVRAALDNDDVFVLEEMRLRLECLRHALADGNAPVGAVMRRANTYWRFVSDAEVEESADADA